MAMTHESEGGSGTRFPEVFAALSAAFGEGVVKVRPIGKGTCRYVTARAVMTRLDEVLGPEHWWDAYEVLGQDTVLCKLTIRLPDGSTVTKQDVGGAAGMQDEGDDDKSAVSDALKRAAVKFGVGRYLYGEGRADFGLRAGRPPELVEDGRGWPMTPGETAASEGWTGGERAAWNERARVARRAASARVRLTHGDHVGEVRDGRGLYGYLRDVEASRPECAGLLAHVQAWGEARGWPDRLVRWDAEQTAGAREPIRAFLAQAKTTAATAAAGA